MFVRHCPAVREAELKACRAHFDCVINEKEALKAELANMKDSAMARDKMRALCSYDHSFRGVSISMIVRG